MNRKTPPFNGLVQPNMSKEAKAVMKYAMQKSCDEQVKSLVDWEADMGYERGKCNKTLEETRSIMKEGMKKICDEQAKAMADVGDKNVTESVQGNNILKKEEHEKRQVRKTNQEKSKLGTKETVDFIIEHYGDVLRKLGKT